MGFELQTTGLVLTITWLVTLFAGVLIQNKIKSRYGKQVVIGLLILIPALYILSWLFT